MSVWATLDAHRKRFHNKSDKIVRMEVSLLLVSENLYTYTA